MCSTGSPKTTATMTSPSEVLARHLGINVEDPACIQFVDAQERYGDPVFFEELRKMWALHVAKGWDYGAHQDPLANFVRSGEILGESGSRQALSLLATKVARLQRLIEQEKFGETPSNEAFEDTLDDLAAYAKLAKILRMRERLVPPPPGTVIPIPAK